jgi:LAS superfamily LD-carboxypeptidase LdcB
VAPPGTSLHRYGTELDVGPPAAYGWLARNAERFGFIHRIRLDISALATTGWPFCLDAAVAPPPIDDG